MARNLFDLSGKTALVTGGSSGIGLGYARGMARQGASIVIWALEEDRNKAAEAMLRDLGSPRVVSAVLDVSSEESVRAEFQRAVATMGKIDCVVSNAGQATALPSFAEMSSKDWHALLNVHLNGGFYVVREAVRHMLTNPVGPGGRGSILITGSLAVFAGGQGIEHYCAAKGGLASMMKSVAAECGKSGIRVNMIAPGYVDTAMSSGRKDVDHSVIEKKVPLGRVGAPSDFEGIAAYLASDAAAYHTGDIITVDGGWTASLF
jgi:NAD(P)-dependent dehydrogenase (short-subunit alcohol dehydrogenase family)